MHANYLFAILLAMIAFLDKSVAIGFGVTSHAECWGSIRQALSDRTGADTQSQQVALFQKNASQVDKHLPQLAPIFLAQASASSAILREEEAYHGEIARQLRKAAKMKELETLVRSHTPGNAALNADAPVFNGIIDTFHRNTLDVAKVKASGIAAIIHKATERLVMQDHAYHNRRDSAKSQGLLCGCYHFSSGDAPADQANYFLNYAQPEDDEVIALDWEHSSTGSNMIHEQARIFVATVHQRVGRWPLLYGGNLMREAVGNQPDPVLANCPLWYSRYNGQPIGIPTKIWPNYTLWQYTDGENGPQPRTTPGVSGADRNQYQGSEEDLRQAWPWAQS